MTEEHASELSRTVGHVLTADSNCPAASTFNLKKSMKIELYNDKWLRMPNASTPTKRASNQ